MTVDERYDTTPGRWHVVRRRLDATRSPVGSKKTEDAAVSLAKALARLSGGRYLVLDPATGEAAYDTATPKETDDDRIT